MNGKISLWILGAILSLTLAPFFLTNIACAEEITIDEIYHFRSIHSPNSVNYVIGDRLLFGAEIIPSGGTNVTASQDSFLDLPLFFIPSANKPNSFVRTVAYNSSLVDPWELVITNGVNTAVVFTPDVVGVEAMPFVKNVSLSGSGTTPTFNWTVPEDVTPHIVTIKLYDLGEIGGEGGVGGGGTAWNLWVDTLVSTATSYTVPEEAELLPDHRYSVAINLDSLRELPLGDPRFSPLQSRSRSFFDFSTEILFDCGDAPVFLPSVDPEASPTGGPVYIFDVAVLEGQTICIDPLVAIGYDYQTGTGDPNFASVVLPEVGDNVFGLYLVDGTDVVFKDLLVAGTEYFFKPGGVDRFLVLGIEAWYGLDPKNTTAFITGVSFVEDGTFTGTMTPLTVNPINVDFDSNTLNLKSKRNDITCYLEFPLGYDLSSIDIDNIKLIVNGNEIPAESSPTGIGDYDSDDIPDLMVKFDATSVQSVVPLGSVVMSIEVKEVDEVIFQGSDAIFVINKDHAN